MTPPQGPPQAALVVALAVTVGCAGAPPPPPPSAPTISVPKPPPERLPARWLSTRGATEIGPAVDGGTLALVGGRRALVAPDGSVREEDEPAPEPLEMLVEVPVATGKRLIALGEHAIYAFDAPLGPLRTIATFHARQQRIGAGPGFVAVLEPEHLRFVDVTTGGRVPAFEHAPLLADIAFHSMTEGVARFSPGGLATTSDGGKTFQLATGRAAELAEAALRPRGAAADAPLLLRWIARTHADPRAVAAHHGVLVREGEALAAAGGLMARVDLATGAVRELVPYPAPDDAPPCQIERSGTFAWLGCQGKVTRNAAGTGSNVENLLLQVDLTRPLDPHPAPVKLQSQFGRFNATSAGNTALSVRCDDGGYGCLGWLRPDGSAKVVPFPGGHEPPTDWLVLSTGDVVAGYQSGPSLWLLHGSSERELARVAFPSGGEGERTGGIDQGADGELRFVARERESRALYVVRQPIDGSPTLTPIPDADEARIAGDVGWAERGERFSRPLRGTPTKEPARFWTTSDGGTTWREAPWPDGGLDSSHGRTSEVGAAFEHLVRIGWGPPLPNAPRPALPSLAPIDAGRPQLACITAGAKPKAAVKPKPPVKPRGHASDEAELRSFRVDSSAGRPTWVFRWPDLSTSAGPTRTLNLPAPEGTEADAWLSKQVAGDGEAIFFVENPPGDTWVVRVATSGARLVHLPRDAQRWEHHTVIAPPRRGEPAVWITRGIDGGQATLWAWDRGEPRAVMRLADLPKVAHLGPPRGGHVVLVGLRDANGVEGAATVLALDASAQPPGLDGWASVSDALVDVPCTGRSSAAVELSPMGVSLVLTDRRSYPAYVGGRARVQVEAGRACLESITGEGVVDLVSMRAELSFEDGALPLTCSRPASR